MARERRKRRSAAREREQRETVSGAIKIGIVVAAVVAIAGAYLWVSSSRRDLNPETLCPAKPVSVTVLLVDVTDPMNAPQRQDFLNQLERLKNSIPRYGKLVVTKVDGTGDRLLSPVIVRCNPGTAQDVNEGTGDPQAVQKQWETGFDKPLSEAFATLTSATAADQSPILESIQSVALTELQKPAAVGKPRRLIIASDLLQHTPTASFYKALPSADEFLRSPAFQKSRTDLRSIDVELWMLQRDDAPRTQPRALPDLWDRLIAAQGGNLTRVYNVSG